MNWHNSSEKNLAKRMTDSSEIDELPEDEAEQPKPSFDQKKLRDGVKSTGRIVWAAAGVMATFGGVLGLYQFFQPSTATKTSDADTLIVAMVAEGVITSQQAENLTSVLSDPSAAISVEETKSITSAVEERDKDTLIAMASMLTRESYTEGLSLLEASAETADDWFELARLSFGRDRALSLRAAEKAVSLNPDDFKAVTFLVQAQAAYGDYNKAKRSAEVALMIANTPMEQLRAEAARLDVAVQARDVGAIEATLKTFNTTLDDYAPIAESARITDNLPVDEFEDHPALVFALAHAQQASASIWLSDFDGAEFAAEESNAWLERLEPHLTGAASTDVQTQKTRNLELLAQVYLVQDKRAEAINMHKAIVQNWEALAEAGNVAARQSLAVAWASYGQAAYALGDKDEALRLYRNGQDIVVEFAAANPESTELRSTAELYDGLIQYLLKEEDPDAFRDRYRTNLERIRQALIQAPRDDERRMELLTFSSTYQKALLQNPDENMSELNWLVGFLDETSVSLSRELGANYYSTLLRYTGEYTAALIDEQRADLPAARVHYEKMLSLYDVLVASPDIGTFDSERFGTELYGFKLGTLYKLAAFKDENSLQAARSGLAMSQELNRGGQLRTADQYYLKLFNDLVLELEVE